MSSAANNKRGSLEEEFQRRMHDAEASPSADLWGRIDHQLTIQENSHYKRSMLFYRQLAAACAAIILLAGGFGVYYLGGNSFTSQVAQVEQPTRAASMAKNNVAKIEQGQIAIITQEATTENAIVTAVQQPDVLRKPTSSGTVRKTSEEARLTLPETALTQPDGSAERPHLATTKATDIALSSLALGSDPTVWKRKPDVTYESVFDAREQVAQQFFSNFQDARQALFNIPPANMITSSGQQRAAFAGTHTTNETPGSFSELSGSVMNRVKELQREKEAMLHTYNDQKKDAGVKAVDEKEKSSDSRWSLGMAYVPSYFEQNINVPAQPTGNMMFSSFAPALSSLRETDNSIAEAREEYIEEIEPGFSFGVEVKTGFKIGKKWKLLSGLGFTQNTARSKSSYVIEQFQNEPNRSGKVSAGPSAIFLSSLDNSLLADSVRVGKTDKYNVHYRYRHLTVPAGIQYEGKLSNDWFWFAGGGVAANILLESAVLASSAEVRDSEYTLSDEESPFRKLQWSGNVTAGVGKRLSNNISVAVGPAFKGYLSSMLANPDRTNASQGRPYNIGLNMAVNYDLGAGSR